MCVLFFCLSANAQKVQSLLNNDKLSKAYVGISVIDQNGQNIIDINADKYFIPASTLKVVTTWLTLKEYGEEYRFQTQVGYRGTIDDSGTLIGDFIVKSGGDPTLGSERNNINGNAKAWIADIQNQLLKAGINCVQGNIIIDDSFFQGPNVSAHWPYEDLGNYYGSGAWATNINENRIRVAFAPTSSANTTTKIQNIEPNLPQIQYVNEVKTNTPNGKDEAYIFGAPFQNKRFIRGTIPVVGEKFTIKGSLPNPPYNLGQMIRIQLKKVFPNNKIKVVNQPINTFTKLKTYYSLPLIDLVKACNHKSINIYADAFLRLLGKAECGDGRMKCGIAYLEKNTSAHLFDGSGLSPANQISPKALTTFIAKKKSYQSTLAQVSKEGTVKYFMRKSPIAKNLRLKSGSVEGVLNYTGILTKNGKEYAIAVMINHSDQPYRVLKSQAEQLITSIYNEL